MSPAEVFAAVHAAAEGEQPLWLVEVGPMGQSTHHLIQPIAAADGRIEALVVGSGRVVWFPAHRVRGVAPALLPDTPNPS
jgi:hypothetical protein